MLFSFCIIIFSILGCFDVSCFVIGTSISTGDILFSCDAYDTFFVFLTPKIIAITSATAITNAIIYLYTSIDFFIFTFLSF